MKKLLQKLESMVDIKLIEVKKTQGIFGMSQLYDYSAGSDSSNSYDNSTAFDYSTLHD